MPWTNPWKIIEDARAGGYAVGAFNMHNVETCQAMVWAAEKAEAKAKRKDDRVQRRIDEAIAAKKKAEDEFQQKLKVEQKKLREESKDLKTKLKPFFII